MGGGEIKLFSLKADNTSGEPHFFTEQESGAVTVELPQRRHPTQTIQINKTEVLGDYYPSQRRPHKHTPPTDCQNYPRHSDSPTTTTLHTPHKTYYLARSKLNTLLFLLDWDPDSQQNSPTNAAILAP